MKRLLWLVRQAGRKLAWPGLAGLAALLLAAAIHVYSSFYLQKELNALSVELAEKPQILPTANLSPELELAQFQTYFPQKSALSQQLLDLHKLADSAEIAIDKITYQQKKVAGLGLVRYELHFSVVSDYVGIRQFLAQLMQRFPNMALETLEFKRFDRQAEIPAADVVMSMYFREAAI